MSSRPFDADVLFLDQFDFDWIDVTGPQERARQAANDAPAADHDGAIGDLFDNLSAILGGNDGAFSALQYSEASFDASGDDQDGDGGVVNHHAHPTEFMSGWEINETLNVSHEAAGHSFGSISSVAATSAFQPPAFDLQLNDAGDLWAKGGNGGGGRPGSGGGGSGGGDGGSGTPVLESYTSGDPNIDDAYEFNIHIDFSGSWTAEQQAIVTWAADYLSSIIVGDVRDDTDLNLVPLDDIVISMSTGRIDGAGNPLLGNVLAQTQITAVRDPGSIDEWLPVTSSITLDSRDLKDSVSEGWSGDWDTIILHEMIHALGFAGVIFDGLGLVDGSGNFTGTNATTAYGDLVPIEGGGGSGTAGSHWDETNFQLDGTKMPTELMTGYIGLGETTYLSDTTIGALADLGYTVQDPSPYSDAIIVDSGLYLV